MEFKEIVFNKLLALQEEAREPGIGWAAATWWLPIDRVATDCNCDRPAIRTALRKLLVEGRVALDDPGVDARNVRLLTLPPPKAKRAIIAVEAATEEQIAKVREILGADVAAIWKPSEDEWIEAMDPSHFPDDD